MRFPKGEQVESAFGHESVAQAGGRMQERDLRRSPELGNGQVSLAIEVSDGQLNAHARVAADLGFGPGTAGILWPTLPGPPSRPLVGRRYASVGFVRCLADQGRGAVRVDPSQPRCNRIGLDESGRRPVAYDAEPSGAFPEADHVSLL